MGKGGIVTLKDISEIAGCSVNTVSRALRGCSDIGVDTQKRIKRIASEKGYISNKIADFMRSGETNMVGVVVSSITNPYFVISIDELSRELGKYNYFPLIMIAKNDLLDIELLEQLIRNRVCGILSFTDLADDVIDYCYKNSVLLMRLGSPPQNEHVSTVYFDRYECGRLVGEEALRRGCQRPCYINCNTVLSNKDLRRGFIGTVTAGGLSVDEYNCNFQHHNEEEAEILAAGIVAGQNDFIFCFNDETAAFVIDVLTAAGYTDYVIYGVDGVCRYLPIYRRINSVGGNHYDMSKGCVNILLNRLMSGESEIVRETYPVELITFDRTETNDEHQ